LTQRRIIRNENKKPLCSGTRRFIAVLASASVNLPLVMDLSCEAAPNPKPIDLLGIAKVRAGKYLDLT